MPDKLVIRCRGLVKGQAEGEALVAPTTLSFWGEVDPISGRVIARGHPLQGPIEEFLREVDRAARPPIQFKRLSGPPSR